ncbi:testis-expressed protein 48 [Erinaceus europaeus]|uniref:Testis-expressed protein 48 n=1 Tax=Erinaceus europaeus TaxID=9365 RepID=A0ABM3Y1I3_ERIEU|nr:testis-expressed protein 48 [Erinaceus europaeus]
MYRDPHTEKQPELWDTSLSFRSEFLRQSCPGNRAPIQNQLIHQDNSAGRAGRIELQLISMAHQNLFSKIFCLCCRDCEELNTVDDSNVPNQTQKHQPSPYGLQSQKNNLDKQKTKHTKSASCLPLEQPLISPEKRDSSSSNSYEFEDVYTHISQSGFHKRNLNRYSQAHWPYQSCLIGRP